MNSKALVNKFRTLSANAASVINLKKYSQEDHKTCRQYLLKAAGLIKLISQKEDDSETQEQVQRQVIKALKAVPGFEQTAKTEFQARINYWADYHEKHFKDIAKQMRILGKGAKGAAKLFDRETGNPVPNISRPVALKLVKEARDAVSNALDAPKRHDLRENKPEIHALRKEYLNNFRKPVEAELVVPSETPTLKSRL